MSGNGFPRGDLLDWFVFSREPELRRDIPPMESKDGEEPTTEALLQRAREIDAQDQHRQDIKPAHAAIKDDKLSNEFWDTL